MPIYTHAGDLDGFASGLIAKWFTEDMGPRPVVPLNYDQLDEIKPPAMVLDLNLPLGHAIWQDEDSWVIDHHGTEPVPMVSCRYNWDNTRCAAKILSDLWQESHEKSASVAILPPDLRWLAKLADVGDLFKNTGSEAFETARAIGLILKKCGWDFLWTYATSGRYRGDYLERDLGSVALFFRALMLHEMEDATKIAEVTKTDSEYGYICLAPHGYASELGKEMTPKVVGPITFVTFGESLLMQVRSKDDASALPTAKLFGGGGHPNAAGYQVPMKELMAKIVEMLRERAKP